MKKITLKLTEWQLKEIYRCLNICWLDTTTHKDTEKFTALFILVRDTQRKFLRSKKK